jgi:hypothetical protein
MYNDPSAKMQSVITNDARACKPESIEQITSKCHGILEMSAIIEATTETIRGKLFSPQPQCDEKRQEPYSIEDTLNCIRSVLNSAIKTLHDINERT